MTKIIKSRAKDLNRFFKLFEKSLKEEYFLYPKENASYLIHASFPKKAQLKKDILNGKKSLYLFYKKARLVGYLLTEENFAGVAFGHWLAVDKNFRNKGVATSLLATWEKDALSQDAHALQLWTTENDIGFYKKKGYILGGKFEKAWLGIDHYLFYKIIGKPNPKKYI